MATFKKFTMKDFSKERYLSTIRSHPIFQNEKTQIYLMLSLTFLSMSFLGIFAINPTLVTITELNKKLEDSTYANDALKTKIGNLSSLQNEYISLTNTWPLVDAAVPDDPHVIYVLGQMQAIAKETGVTVTGLQAFEVELTKGKSRNKEASFTYSVTVQGEAQNLMQFIKTVSSFDRATTIEGIDYSNDPKTKATIRARSFFVL